MNIKKLEAVVEAILFTMGEAVEIERLAAAVENYPQHDDPLRRRRQGDSFNRTGRPVPIVHEAGNV